MSLVLDGTGSGSISAGSVTSTTVTATTIDADNFQNTGGKVLLKGSIEFASNSGGEGVTANTTYTNIAYNSTSNTGSVIPSVAISSTTATTKTKYRCYFTTNFTTNDIVALQISMSSGRWTDVSYLNHDAIAVGVKQGNTPIGIFSDGITIDTNYIEISFSNAGRCPSGTYGTAAATWSDVNSLGWRYRFVKYSFAYPA